MQCNGLYYNYFAFSKHDVQFIFTWIEVNTINFCILINFHFQMFPELWAQPFGYFDTTCTNWRQIFDDRFDGIHCRKFPKVSNSKKQTNAYVLLLNNSTRTVIMIYLPHFINLKVVVIRKNHFKCFILYFMDCIQSFDKGQFSQKEFLVSSNLPKSKPINNH